ncbi:hypothetical protein ACFZF3_002709 [Salmonella enterica]|nr:hypothetical protein C3433_23290 [Citrobacter freundii]
MSRRLAFALPVVAFAGMFTRGVSVQFLVDEPAQKAPALLLAPLPSRAMAVLPSSILSTGGFPDDTEPVPFILTELASTRVPLSTVAYSLDDTAPLLQLTPMVSPR